MSRSVEEESSDLWDGPEAWESAPLRLPNRGFAAISGNVRMPRTIGANMYRASGAGFAATTVSWSDSVTAIRPTGAQDRCRRENARTTA